MLELRDVRLVRRGAGAGGRESACAAPRDGGAARSERCGQIHASKPLWVLAPVFRALFPLSKPQHYWFAQPPARALGAGFCAEDRRLFTALSVRDNLLVAARAPQTHAQGWAALAVAQRLERVLDLFPALSTMLERSAAQMSGGEQQMLGLAHPDDRAHAAAAGRACEGIAPVLVAAMRDAVLALQRDGMSLLVAEQNGILATRADRVITLKAQTPTRRLTASHIRHDHHQPAGHRPVPSSP